MGRRTRVYSILFALLVVIAVLLILYFGLKIFYFDRGVNLWLLILAAAVVACGAFILGYRDLKREQMIRRLYLSDEGIYNFEIGYVPISRIEGSDDFLQLVMFAATSLVEMSYGFEVAGLPDDFEPSLMIATERLRFHRPEGEDGYAVIDQWKGSLVRISSLHGEGEQEVLGTFGNAKDLSLLLDDHWNTRKASDGMPDAR
ncbi:MAG: hypothetical protein ACOYIP_07675 [Coriobacteriales bacterium]|jgi:hypothetical protein